MGQDLLSFLVHVAWLGHACPSSRGLIHPYVLALTQVDLSYCRSFACAAQCVDAGRHLRECWPFEPGLILSLIDVAWLGHTCPSSGHKSRDTHGQAKLHLRERAAGPVQKTNILTGACQHQHVVQHVQRLHHSASPHHMHHSWPHSCTLHCKPAAARCGQKPFQYLMKCSVCRNA